MSFLFLRFVFRAEEAIDAVIRKNSSLQAESSKWNPSNTVNMHFVGYKGFTPNLTVRLIQHYGVSPAVANRLVKAYGGRAVDVLQIAKEECSDSSSSKGAGKAFYFLDDEQKKAITPDDDEKIEERLLVKGFPFLEAEVIFTTRYEWVIHAEDFLAHRTRLAFLNRNAAISVIPRVVELMGKELGWDFYQQEKEMKRCLEFMRHIGGSTPLAAMHSFRMAMKGDMFDIFQIVDSKKRGYLLYDELSYFSELLNYQISNEEMMDCLAYNNENIPMKDNKKITFDNLFNWWNSDRLNPGLEEIRKEKMANIETASGSGTMFG
jgi:hypothetical protein